MTGFDFRVRIDTEAGVATAEVLLVDGSRDAFIATAIDGTFDGYMAFFMSAMTNCSSNWIGALHAWTSAWPDAAMREGIEMLDKLAKGLQ